MPHTRRKKPSQNKRLQVTDDSGWTHVTTTQRAKRVGQKNNKVNGNVNGSTKTELDQGLDEDEVVEVEVEVELEPLFPAEAPHRTKQSDLQRQLDLYRERWEGSETWQSVVEGLRRGLPSLLPKRDNRNEDVVEGKDKDTEYDISIVCIGLGSPSGFLRGGWVDRRTVSIYQLAALTSIMRYIERNNSNPKPNLKVYAQDPVFNTHDKTLLSSQSITTLESPHAFEKVTPRTLLFCPGAERRHVEILLARNPAMVFGGPLEEIESDKIRDFVARRNYLHLKTFETLEAAFWGMSIYFPPPGSEKKEGGGDD